MRFFITTPLEACISAVSLPISSFQKVLGRWFNFRLYAANRDILACLDKKLLMKKARDTFPKALKQYFKQPPLRRLLSQPFLNRFQIFKKP